MEELVSIITPVYNAEKHIEETIQSVLAQTYTNWEWNIIDDVSTDSSVEIIKKYAKKDHRIHLFYNEINSGAAISRNKGLEYSKGVYIAYIDTDDLWVPQKLFKQVQFMSKNKIGFSCTGYRFISEDGKDLNRKVEMKPHLNYKEFLMNNLLLTVGIMIDLRLVDKKYCVMKNLRRRQDAATWLQILKSGHLCYGVDEILASYRRTSGSLSSNKIKAIKGIWYLYRKVENLNIFFSFYCFVRYAILAIWKRVSSKEIYS